MKKQKQLNPFPLLSTVAAGAFLLHAATTQGSDRSAQSEDSFLADMPIVLTASRLSQPIAAPRNSQSMMLTHRFNQNWNARLMNYQVGATHFPDSDAGPGDNPQYFIDFNRRWDARVAYRFKAGRGNGELALIVQNLGDAHYFEYRHDNELPGRTVWLNLKLEM